MRRLAPLILAGFIAAGCGAHTPEATDAAQLVPATATAYEVVAPGAAEKARAALAGFGAAAGAVPYLEAGRTARLHGGIVGFADPSDPKPFERRLDARGLAHARVRGWVVFARAKALVDAVRRSRVSLAQTAWYEKAASTVPEGALVRVVVPGRPWRTGALSEDGGAVRLEVHTPTKVAASRTALGAADVPAGAVVALAGTSSTLPPESGTPLAELSRVLGADVRGLLRGIGGLFVLSAAPGEPVPTVTLQATPARRAQGLAAIRRFVRTLAGRAAPAPPRDGLATLDLGAVELVYGVHDGRVVLSDDPSLGGGGSRLADDSTFRSAAHAARLPAANDGFLYVDARRSLAAARAFAALANQALPPGLASELEPLRALLTWTGVADGVRTDAYLRAS